MGPIKKALHHVVIRCGFRGEIGADGILPNAAHRIDVRGHVQRVRSRWRGRACR
jgi:hypothetical protein